MNTLGVGFGQKVEALTSSEAIIKGGLNWTVSGQPIAKVTGDLIPGYQAIVRQDNGEVLGISGERYTPVQNIECFKFIDDFVGNGHAKIERVFSFKGGRRFGILARMPFEIPLKKGTDTVGVYLRVQSSHDGSSGVTLDFLPIRAICWNMISVDFAQYFQQRKFKVKHTVNVNRRIEGKMLLLNAQNFISELTPKLEQLTNKPIDANYVDLILNKLFDVKEGEEISTRAENELAEIKRLTYHGLGNNGQTAWDLFNGITEYVGHHRATRGDEENRVISALDGSGQKLVTRALTLLTE